MIELCDVNLRAGDFHLQGVSLKIMAGQYGVLIGKTGSGKTTILEAICGLRRIERGRIVVHNTDVTDWSPGDREIGYVPQDVALFPTLTVRQHLEFALRIRKWSPQQIAGRTSELAEVLGIIPLLERTPENLSGGESQRVALGRALSFRPTVLLLDEPLSALDSETKIEMATLLGTVKQTNRVTVLHVTHHPEELTGLSDCSYRIASCGVTRNQVC